MAEAREFKMREWNCNIFSTTPTNAQEKPMFDRKRRHNDGTSASPFASILHTTNQGGDRHHFDTTYHTSQSQINGGKNVRAPPAGKSNTRNALADNYRTQAENMVHGKRGTSNIQDIMQPYITEKVDYGRSDAR